MSDVTVLLLEEWWRTAATEVCCEGTQKVYKNRLNGQVKTLKTAIIEAEDTIEESRHGWVMWYIFNFKKGSDRQKG